MTKKIFFSMPIRTVSESNSTEHWAKKGARHKNQKWMVTKCFRDNNVKVKLPVQITLIRIAPKFLDEHDNLRISFKWIADSLSECIIPGKGAGRADDSKEITWKYDQRKGNVREYAAEVLIEEI